MATAFDAASGLWGLLQKSIFNKAYTKVTTGFGDATGGASDSGGRASGVAFADCVAEVGLNNLAPFQVTVGATATQVVAARGGRGKLVLVQGSTTDIYFGPTNGVTLLNGALLPGVKGASLTLDYTGALWAISSTGTEAVTGYETY